MHPVYGARPTAMKFRDHPVIPAQPRSFTLALVQMRVDGGEKQRNLARTVERIAEAAKNGAQVALLPECMDLGWTHPSALSEAEPIPDGFPCSELRRAAKQNHLYVCAGVTEKSGDRVFNSAVLIDPDGEVLALHRKLNELEIGHPFYAQGDRLQVAETEFGTFGLMICADAFAKDRVISRSLCYMGADVILSPCAWAAPADYDNEEKPYGDGWRRVYIPVAREFSTAIIGVSNVGPMTAGPWRGMLCIGCSLVVGPGGTELLQAPYGVDAECVLYTEIKPVPRPARGAGWSNVRPGCDLG